MDNRQLIADLLSALEYHTEQTRPIAFSKVAIEAAREYLQKPAQPMHPEIKKMYEDYFDKCFRESSEPMPENFIDALKFDVAMRDVDAEQPAQRTWVGLTKDEVEILAYKAEGNTWIAVELTETKLKEKNT